VAGDVVLHDAFEQVRKATLAHPRDAEALHNDVRSMRAKMRAELDRSDAHRFDLKQGEAGLVDLEFLLQYLVLRDAHAQPALLVARDTPGLLDAVCAGGTLDAATCADLRAAHATLLDAGLRCTLDRRPRIVIETDAIAAARAVIREAARSVGLTFSG
jgi:[glutamine synthetase] adenylyltransferase / [glutamine synthetase]-adenylyl-L-tyrosine phosphorylase